MAPQGRGGRWPSKRPIDLTGKLSLAEKNDYNTLVSAITDKLLNNISSIFDSPPVSPVESAHGFHHWLSLPLIHRKENKPSLPASQAVKAGGLSETYTMAHQIIEKEEKEAMTPQLKELKKDALTFFRKWQGNVLTRLRELKVNDPNAEQEASRGRGRGRGARGGRGPRGGRGGRGGGRGGGAMLTLATGPPRIPTAHLDRDLANRFTPIPTSLWTLPLEKRKLLMHMTLLLMLSLNEYSANARQLLLYLTSSLNLTLRMLQDEETRLAQRLGRVALEVVPEPTDEQKAEENKPSRKFKVGLGNGTSQSTKTGSIANSLKDNGFGCAHGGYGLGPVAISLLGSMSETNVPVGNLFGIIPTRPTPKILETFGREMQDFSFSRIHSGASRVFTDTRDILNKDRRLRLVFAMSGWLAEGGDMVQPWTVLGNHSESYALTWETTVLSNLGISLETVIKSSAWSLAKKEIIPQTIYTSLMECKWPHGLLKISKLVDNPWSVGMVRAEKAGAMLADAIMRCKIHGDRPVSLIGYSLAARAIYTCLMVLAERRQFGLIESVVLMGTPAPSESRVWLTLKSIVCGRLINVYSENDYLLGFLYRTSNIHSGVAGLQEIQGADGVENHNVSDLVSGHLRYQTLTGKILKDIGWEDINMQAVRGQRPVLVERNTTR